MEPQPEIAFPASQARNDDAARNFTMEHEWNWDRTHAHTKTLSFWGVLYVVISKKNWWNDRLPNTVLA